MAYGSVNVGTKKIDTSIYLTTDRLGIPGGIATLNATGRLSDSQLPEIDCYTREETDNNVSSRVSGHNSDETAHGDIRARIVELQSAISAVELKYAVKITDNPYTVTFTTLDGVVVTGVWNDELARIEF